MYWEEGKSIRKIAKELGESETRIYNLMVKYNIPRRDRLAHKTPKDTRYRDPNFLREQYWEKGKSLSEIERMCGLKYPDGKLALRWMRIHGIPTRTKEEACALIPKKKLRNNVCLVCGKHFNPSSLDDLWCSTECKNKWVEISVLYEKPLSYKYIAGIIDGEGCISIRRVSRKRESFVPFVTIVNTSQILLSLLRYTLYLDGIRTVLKKRFGKTRKPIFELEVGSKGCVKRLLDRIIPYLVVKRKQAGVLLEFLKLEHYHIDPPNIKEKKRALYEKLKELNKKGI